ncbi:hypothetical protein JTB14_037700 [Gonioctena quinquepunctata]|nr:hypothetical protein JTB14_037700 [Gonioctena quinquepunctata]
MSAQWWGYAVGYLSVLVSADVLQFQRFLLEHDDADAVGETLEERDDDSDSVQDDTDASIASDDGGEIPDRAKIRAFEGQLAGLYRGEISNLEELTQKKLGVEIFRLTIDWMCFGILFRRFNNQKSRNDGKVDRSAPIGEMFEKIIHNSTKCYSLGADATFDEKLEAFRERCNFIQYLPSEPTKKEGTTLRTEKNKLVLISRDISTIKLTRDHMNL